MSAGEAGRAPGHPRLSVVVAAWNGADALRACLAGLRAQDLPDLEVVVARNFPLGTPDNLAAGFPGFVDLPLPSTTTVPRLRAAGLARTRGDVIAFIEDHAVCASGWATSLLEAHAGPYAAVGGPVDQAAGARLVDWGAYFADYGRYLPPCRGGPVPDLSGINVSYKRAFLDSARAQLRDGVYEAVLHEQVRATGGVLFLAPGAIVTHAKRYRTGATAMQMLHLGRAFGAGRGGRWSRVRRLAHVLAAPLVALLLAGRVAGAVVRAGRARLVFVAASPWLLLFLGSWAVGEGIGYWAGAGSSAAKWL